MDVFVLRVRHGESPHEKAQQDWMYLRDTGLVSPPLNRLRSDANISPMNCDHVMFTGHAVQRMFERRIQKGQIRDLLESGEVIAEYPNDVPLPSSLLLGFLGDRPIRMVVAFDDLPRPVML